MIELIKELSFRNPYYLLLWALIPLIYFILKRYYKQQIDTINLPESGILLKFKKKLAGYPSALSDYISLVCFTSFHFSTGKTSISIARRKSQCGRY